VLEKDIQDWYNKRHHALERNAWRPYEAYPVFLDHLDVESDRKLLDVGCGTGHLLKAADQRGLETYGVDISEEGVKISRRVSPNSQISVQKGENLQFPDRFFDYVTCVGALEHFLDMGKGVKEMVRVGKDDALYCIVVPNFHYFFWKISKTRGTEQQGINENLLSLSQWRDLFVREGLSIAKIYQDSWPVKETHVFSSLNPLRVGKRMIYKLIWTLLPLKYTYQFIFVLRKSRD